MKVEPADSLYIEEIMSIFDDGRNYMRQNGNKNQWINGYPSRELILNDIANHNLYVLTENKEIQGVFAFIIGPDKTYAYIENGKWLNNEEYGTIHRIAGKKGTHGILETALNFCFTKISSIRIDTHADNKKMQQLMEKFGFTQCGIIYVEDGSPRLAFQKIK